MYKKSLIIFMFTLIIFSTNITFGDCSECKIKDGPPEVLNKYIDNLRKVISNISSGTAGADLTKPGVKKDINYTKDKITGVYNKMLNWDGYYSYFDFYVMYSLKNEYIPEIWRDYNLLENESKGLDKYFKYLTKKGFSGVNLTKDDICKGLSEIDSCNFEGGEILDVIGQVITNHEAVKDYYRLSIIGKKNLFKGDIKLVNITFKDDFNEYYNENTTNHCGQCEEGGFKKIEKEIEKIVNRQENAKYGMKSWQDAIAILDGTLSKREYERLERKLLEKELRRNGTSMRASENVLKNLSRYNETGGFSLDNNFITNSYDYVKNSVTSQIESFTDSIRQLFKDKKESIAVSNFGRTDENLKTTKNIEETIKELYKKELPYAQLEDVSNEDLQSKIIELHYNMTQAIYSLDKTKKVSEKVCNSQAFGEGKCDTK